MPSNLRHLRAEIARHKNGEEGAISILNLYFIMAMAIFGGIAVDVANLVTAKNQLQVAADVAAHAAMTSRRTMDVEGAKAEGIRFAKLNMPENRFGDVLRTENIQFGSFDQSSRLFTVDNDLDEAVWVKTDRLLENANPVSSYLLKLVGFGTFDVATTAVYLKGDIPCLGDGFYADGRVDMQSNNNFMNGFCIRSNSRVELNNGNFFEHEDGVIVSMPTPDDLVIPGSGYSQNTGLQEAERYGHYPFDVDAFIAELVAGLVDPNSDYYRTNIDNATVIQVDATGTNGGGNGNGNGNGNKAKANKGNGNGNGNGNGGGGDPDPVDPDPVDPDPVDPDPDNGGGSCSSFGPDCLTSGRIHEVACSGGSLNIPSGTYSNVVVMTDCELDFSNDVILEDATFLTRATGDRSVSAPSGGQGGLQIGRNDNCAAGGGAQIITFGGMRTAAKMSLYGGQIVAAGDVKFAAQANGFDGASVIAGGEIDGTSNSDFGTCKADAEVHFTTTGRARLAG